MGVSTAPWKSFWAVRRLNGCWEWGLAPGRGTFEDHFTTEIAFQTWLVDGWILRSIVGADVSNIEQTGQPPGRRITYGCGGCVPTATYWLWV